MSEPNKHAGPMINCLFPRSYFNFVKIPFEYNNYIDLDFRLDLTGGVDEPNDDTLLTACIKYILIKIQYILEKIGLKFNINNVNLPILRSVLNFVFKDTRFVDFLENDDEFNEIEQFEDDWLLMWLLTVLKKNSQVDMERLIQCEYYLYVHACLFIPRVSYMELWKPDFKGIFFYPVYRLKNGLFWYSDYPFYEPENL